MSIFPNFLIKHNKMYKKSKCSLVNKKNRCKLLFWLMLGSNKYLFELLDINYSFFVINLNDSVLLHKNINIVYFGAFTQSYFLFVLDTNIFFLLLYLNSKHLNIFCPNESLLVVFRFGKIYFSLVHMFAVKYRFVLFVKMFTLLGRAKFVNVLKFHHVCT